MRTFDLLLLRISAYIRLHPCLKSIIQRSVWVRVSFSLLTTIAIARIKTQYKKVRVRGRYANNRSKISKLFESVMEISVYHNTWGIPSKFLFRRRHRRCSCLNHPLDQEAQRINLRDVSYYTYKVYQERSNVRIFT